MAALVSMAATWHGVSKTAGAAVAPADVAVARRAALGLRATWHSAAAAAQGQQLQQQQQGRQVASHVVAAYASDIDQGYGGVEESAPVAGTKLYCGNLPFNVDNETLAGLFQDHANVEQADVVYDRDTNRSRGFGFVIMASVEDAQLAIDALDGQEYGGRNLKVNFPKQSSDRGGDRFPRERRMDMMQSPGAGNKVYVGNLAWGVDDDGLSNLFSNFGNVLEAKVVLDRESGRSRGFGFVTFQTADEGNDAVNQMNNAEIEGRVLRVSIANDRPSTGRGRY